MVCKLRDTPSLDATNRRTRLWLCGPVITGKRHCNAMSTRRWRARRRIAGGNGILGVDGGQTNACGRYAMRQQLTRKHRQAARLAAECVESNGGSSVTDEVISSLCSMDRLRAALSAVSRTGVPAHDTRAAFSQTLSVSCTQNPPRVLVTFRSFS